jgi:tRNA modification GTPase
MEHAASSTIVAPATAPGAAALGVIRVSGPLVPGLAARFRGQRSLLPRRSWVADYVAATGAVLDEAMFTYFKGPASYTGEDLLEISCHGNTFIINKIIGDLVSSGCQWAEPGEFTRRAFCNGKMDLTRAEAVIEVIRARSDRELEAAQRQLRGDLGRRVSGLVERVLRACAAVEAYIDFPEDDLPREDRQRRTEELAAILEDVGRMSATRRHGELLREGARVALLGPPNAGKSSLLNRLAGYERAIVHHEPGTTRDFLEEWISLGPHRIRIVDTAGLREGFDPVEQAGVARSRAVASAADLILWTVDGSSESPPLPCLPEGSRDPETLVVVANKADLGCVFDVAAGFGGHSVVTVSAITGFGMADLTELLIGRLDRLSGTGVFDEGVWINQRHAAALESVESSLADALDLLRCGAPLELVGASLRVAVGALGDIVGRIDNEAVLDCLFAEFCIGK